MTAPTMLHALHEQVARLGQRPALWTKRGGTYSPTSWTQYERKVIAFARGLEGLGFGRGNALAILSFNREEWLVADLAAMALGGVAVGLYTTLSPEQIAYVVGHCEAELVVVENARYLEAVQRLKPTLPKLKHIIVIEPPATLPEGALSFQDVLARGEREADAKAYWERVQAIDPRSLATLIYTSGTTGPPKGVMLSHRNICWTAERLGEVSEIVPQDILLSYLPLSHIAEQVCSIYIPLVGGMEVYFAESIEKLPENLKEVRPTVFFAVPRVWEKFKARAEERMALLPFHRKKLLAWARGLGAQRNALEMAKEWISLPLEAQFQLARRLVFRSFKERIGFDRTRIFATAAAPIARDVLDFFTSVDIVLREVYGQSEGTGPTSLNLRASTRHGTVGRPMDGVEVRIAQDGEVLVRGDNVCLGYYKEPQATLELIQDGWLHSGDVGELDGDGYLRITGRKRDIIVTSGGKKTAPGTIEDMLKAVGPVGNAMVIGEARPYLVALLPLDPERIAPFAKERGWPADAHGLANEPKFINYLEERIARDVNPRLSKFETIKKFRVLPHDFTVETGELTPTMKVRRSVVEKKYASVVAELYA